MIKVGGLMIKMTLAAMLVTFFVWFSRLEILSPLYGITGKFLLSLKFL
uniref:Uncharacterized protein n=1 Tax=Manihot esculenta TaxID=3983 RepID=A0A199UBS8_MANES